MVRGRVLGLGWCPHMGLGSAHACGCPHGHPSPIPTLAPCPRPSQPHIHPIITSIPAPPSPSPRPSQPHVLVRAMPPSTSIPSLHPSHTPIHPIPSPYPSPHPSCPHIHPLSTSTPTLSQYPSRICPDGYVPISILSPTLSHPHIHPHMHPVPISIPSPTPPRPHSPAHPVPKSQPHPSSSGRCWRGCPRPFIFRIFSFFCLFLVSVCSQFGSDPTALPLVPPRRGVGRHLVVGSCPASPPPRIKTPRSQNPLPK